MPVFVEDLIESAKLRTLVPMSQSTFADSDLIAIANDELRLKIVSDIMSVREDFFLTSDTVAIQAGLANYAVPERAVANALKAVFYRDSAGGRKLLPRVGVDQATSSQPGTPDSYYIAGDEIVLLPTPSASTGSVEFSYFQKPNQLIATASCAKVTATSTVGAFTTFTVNTDLTASIAVGDKVDFLSAKSPHLLWSKDVVVTGISATQIQVASTDVQNAAGTLEPKVGDYICPAKFANLPQVPEEFFPVLGQMVAVRLLAALGHLDKWNAAKAELKETRDEALLMVKNRVQSSPIVVNSRNPLV